MSWYRSGTLSVTNGSPVVTGTGTAFVANVQIGHAFNAPDGKVYEVAAVNSDTQITLGSNYLGATASGQTYSITPNQGFAQYAAAAIGQLITQFTAYISTTLAGRFGDGTAAAPGITFSSDQDTGLYRVAENSIGVTTGGVLRATFDGTGTTSLGYRLNLSAAQGVAPGIVFGQAATASWLLQNTASANAMALVDNQFGSTRQYWDASGNIGFGTTSPGSKGHFAGANATQLTIEATAGTGDTGLVVKTTARQWNVGQNIGGSGVGLFCFYDVTAGGLRWAIETGGNLRPGVDNAFSIGTSANRVSVVYAATSAINTSDERSKEEIGSIPDDWLDAWGEVAWCRFKFIEAVAEKGDAARWHIGLVAQRVQAAFTARGLNAMTIGLLCYDTWDAQAPHPAQEGRDAIAALRDADGEAITAGQEAVPALPGSPGREAGDRYGLRYEEWFAIEAAWQRRELTRLGAQVSALQHA